MSSRCSAPTKTVLKVHLHRITAHDASRDLRSEHRPALEAAHPHLVGGGARRALCLQVQRFDAVARKNAASEIARGLPAHRHPAPHLRRPRGRRRRATAGPNRAKRAARPGDSVAMRPRFGRTDVINPPHETPPPPRNKLTLRAETPAPPIRRDPLLQDAPRRRNAEHQNNTGHEERRHKSDHRRHEPELPALPGPRHFTL